MFYLRQEAFDQEYSRFRVLKAQKEFGLQNYILYESLSKIIDTSISYPRYEHIFLLDENRFDFFRFDIHTQNESTFTVQDLQKIVLEKTEYLKQFTREELLFSNIDNIQVNETPKNFVIGEKGDISFRLSFVYLKRQTVTTFNSIYGNFFNQKNLTILPETFHTIGFLKKNLKKENFLLLYIRETHCKAILINSGFYQKVETINFGINALMQMYKDNGISKYRYKTYEEIEGNPFAKNLVVQTLEFYANLLCKRIQDKKLGNIDIFAVSPIMKNGHFMEIFNHEYSKENKNYIVPFHYSDNLETFNKNREPEDIDTLIYINTLKKKELEKFFE